MFFYVNCSSQSGLQVNVNTGAKTSVASAGAGAVVDPGTTTTTTSSSSSSSGAASTAPTPAATDLNIMSYGAVASGTANNLAAIQATITAAAAKGVNVYVPAGTFGYSGVINLTGPVKLYGTGATSILNALDPLNETIMVRGDSASVSYLKLTIAPNTTPRQNPFEAERVTLRGATHFTVDHMIITGGAAAGILSEGGQYGTITNNQVSNTLADSIHMTGGSAHIVVTNNVITNSGDDGIAVVSYLGDGVLVNDIQASNNTISNNVGGRGMTVVGGTNVTYTNNTITNMPVGGASCMYIAQESSYQTYPASYVTLTGNTVTNCGGCGGNHGGILIWGAQTANSYIKLIGNTIIQTGTYINLPTISITSQNNNISLVQNQVKGNAAVYIQTPSQVIQNVPYQATPNGTSTSTLVN